MKKMVVLWIAIMILLVSSILIIGYNFNKGREPYYSLESDLEEAAGVYMSKENISMLVNQEIKVDSNTLLAKGYITKMNVSDDECTGYVSVTKKVNGYKYKVYIKCNNYVTGE